MTDNDWTRALVERDETIAQLRADIERLRDDPEADATDFAHPAWWRGQDYCFAVMCKEANEILDGKEPTGTCNEPWESLRQRLWRLRAPTGDAVEEAWKLSGWKGPPPPKINLYSDIWRQVTNIAAAITAAEARGRAAEREEIVQAFAEAISHGDETHRQWLRDAATAFIDGRALPPPTSNSNERQAGVREGIEMAAQWHENRAARLQEAVRKELGGRRFAREQADTSRRHSHDAVSIRALLPAAPKEGE